MDVQSETLGENFVQGATVTEEERIATQDEAGNETGRYDEMGNFIKNIECLPDLFSRLTKFSTEKKLSPYAIIVVFKKIDKPTRDDVYELLRDMECRPSNVKGIVKRGAKGFTIEFYDATWKKHIVSQANRKYSDDVNAFPCIADERRITVSGVPCHLPDEDILDFLSIFGKFHTDPDKIYHRSDEFGVYKGERVYLCKELEIDILSSYSIYGHTLTFRYPGQPHTCVVCYQRGHSANDCSVSPRNHHLRQSNAPDVNTLSEVPNTNHTSGSAQSSYASATQSKASSSSAANLRPGGALKRTWGDGGSSMPGGTKPRFIGNLVTLGDHLSKARVTSRKIGKYRKVSTVTRSDEEVQNDQLVNAVNTKIQDAETLISDAIFSDGDNRKDTSAKKVHNVLNDIRSLLPQTDDEWVPVVDGSPDNIKRLLEYDIKLLSNCSKRIGRPVGNRFESKKFKGMLNNYIEILHKEKPGSGTSTNIEHS